MKRSRQGRRTVYSFDVTPVAIAQGFLRRPDPSRKVQGQRDLIPRHAQEFGSYIVEQPEWVSPPILLRAPDIFRFEPIQTAGARQWGYLEIAKMDRDAIDIMDGHHRILGVYDGYDDLVAKRTKLRGLLQAAERNQEPTVEHYRTQLRAVEDRLRELDTETIDIALHVVDARPKFEQIFVDVNDNAIGVRKSLRASFDSRSVVNRSLEEVVQHVLLKGRVDMQQDSIGRKSPYLLGLKHVADLVRTLKFGMRSRVTKNREKQLSERELVVLSIPFFDGLYEGFPDLHAVADDEMTPVELRERSMLGSATMLRALAGVWYALTTRGWEAETITRFFRATSGDMASPLPEGNMWLRHGLEADFYKGANGYTSPNAHRGVDLHLMDTMIEWAEKWAERNNVTINVTITAQAAD